ncbi:MAG: hypothetical protein Q7U57_11615 [Methylovulum sp.]|nr:hypothetical protein [Methylovulum sp.]
MNNNLLVTALWTATLVGIATDVSARPEYVAPTGAAGCTSCHFDNSGSGFKPGVLAAAASPLGKIAGLKAFLHPVAADTKPVLHPINTKWDVTVGEVPLVIPLQVSDAENDTFAVHGSAPTGYTLSKVYIKNNLPTVDLKWAPTAAQAGKIYPLSLYVQETGTGRTLKSNAITANIQAWAARVSPTKYVSQFMLQGAQWQNNTLSLGGQLIFKANLTAAQRSAALANLTLNLTSANGTIIHTPMKLLPQANGNWSRNIPLTRTEVPCTIKLSYEGLRVARAVSLAPATTCVK